MMKMEKTKKNILLIQILRVYIMTSLQSWMMSSCLHYHCRRGIAAWLKKYGQYYECTHTIVDTGNITWHLLKTVGPCWKIWVI